jgi:hypothetical protein
MHSRSSIDSCDPQLPEIAFLLSSVTVGVLLSFFKVMLRHREDFASSTPVAFRARENALATAVGGNFVLRTRHKLLFLD